MFRDMSKIVQDQVLQTEWARVSTDGVEKKVRVRKVILATNIAETSITFPYLDWVIDCAFSKVATYIAEHNAHELVNCRCTWAQLWQRRGRTGRRRPGCYIPIMTKDMMEQIEKDRKYPTPPVLRSELSGVLLKICAAPGGYKEFEWISMWWSASPADDRSPATTRSACSGRR
jgi:ATP-dependent helicase HrpB